MTTTEIDRPAAIRRALCALVAERGFHGASMSAVAKEAGVATGTAYVHYASKEDLVHATYLEIKRDLGQAVMDSVEQDSAPADRYRQMWMATYSHLRDEPERAKFMVQLDASPFYESAHRMVMEQGDPLLNEASRAEIVSLLIDLPMEVLYSMSLGSAVRLAASDTRLTKGQLATMADASWRAITRRN